MHRERACVALEWLLVTSKRRERKEGKGVLERDNGKDGSREVGRTTAWTRGRRNSQLAKHRWANGSERQQQQQQDQEHKWHT